MSDTEPQGTTGDRITMTNFDRTAAQIIDGLDFQSDAHSYDRAISEAESALAAARERRANYLAYRQEQLELLELLGYARREADGDYTITRPNIATRPQVAS